MLDGVVLVLVLVLYALVLVLVLVLVLDGVVACWVGKRALSPFKDSSRTIPGAVAVLTRTPIARCSLSPRTLDPIRIAPHCRACPLSLGGAP